MLCDAYLMSVHKLLFQRFVFSQSGGTVCVVPFDLIIHSKG